jgi:hypothetical protein
VTIAFRSSGFAPTTASGTTTVVPKPAGVVAGDFMFATIYMGTATVTPPTGWVCAGQAAQPVSTSGLPAINYGVSTWYKIATASEPTSYTWTASAATFNVGMISAYSGVNVDNPFLSTQTASDQNPAASVSTSANAIPGKTTPSLAIVVGLHSNGAITMSAAGTGAVTRSGPMNISNIVVFDIPATPSAGNTFTVVQNNTISYINGTHYLLNPDAVIAHGNTVNNGISASTVTLPSGVAVGDTLLLAWDSGSGGPAPVPPAGWTTIATAGTQAVAFKRAVFSDTQVATGASPSPAFGSGTANAYVVTRYVGLGKLGVSPVTQQGVTNYTASTSALGFPSITEPVGTAALLAFSIVTSNGPAQTFQSQLANRVLTLQSIYTFSILDVLAPPASPAPAYTHTSASPTTGADFIVAMSGSITAPQAPTLTAPSAGAYSDLAANGGPFTWTFQSTGTGDAQTAYVFRRKISDAPAYEYWNAGTGAFQSTLVWNNSASTSLTFAPGIFTDGNVYNWSVTTQGQAPQLYQGPFASDATVTASAAPTLMVTAPTGTQVTQTPTVIWATTPQAGVGESQTAYRVVVESGGYGTTPGSGVAQYDSGVTASSAQSLLIPVVLPNTTTYRAFVQTTVTGGQVSGWAFTTFTVSLNAPATPTITAYYDTAQQRVVIAVQGRDNLLSTNQASLETDTTGWAAGANTTIARSTAQAADGVASLSLTATAAGTVSATTPTGTAGLPVVAGGTYTALAAFRAATAARACTVALSWYDASGAALSTLTGSAANDTTTGFTQATYTGKAPAGAAFAAIVVTVAAAAAAEVHYADTLSVAPGTSTTWTRGGLAGAGIALIQRAIAGVLTTVRGAAAVALTGPSQASVVYDYELTPLATASYSATVNDTI